MIQRFNKKLHPWVIMIFSLLVPGSGHVLLGRPVRGLLLVLWMFFFGYITFHLTTKDISIIGRLSGGFAIWVVSIFEIYKSTMRRY